MRRLLILAAVTAGLVIGGVTGCAGGNDAAAHSGTFQFVAPGGRTDIFYDPPARRGRPGPVVGPDLLAPSRTLSLDNFSSQVVVLNVWGQWCGPCRTEATQLQQVDEAVHGDAVALLGIDVRDNQQAAQDFVTDRHLMYPSIYDPAMRTMIAFGGKYPTTVIPSTLVLDRQHRVAAVFLRELLAADLLPIVRRIAAEPYDQPAPPERR